MLTILRLILVLLTLFWSQTVVIGQIDAYSVATNKLKTASLGDFTRTHGLSGRASSRNVRNIAEDMKSNGYQGAPIKVLESNGERFILDGHHRVQAARRAGIDVPFESVSPSNLSNFGYNSVDDVIRASTEAGPVKLRP